LVPKSVTLNDPEWRNGLILYYFSKISMVAFGANYVEMAEDTQILSATEM